MYQDTSRQAYQDLRPKLTKRQIEIYSLFRTYGRMTNYEVSERAGRPINCISGRTGELVKKGMLELKGHKIINGSRHRVLGLITDGQQSFC